MVGSRSMPCVGIAAEFGVLAEGAVCAVRALIADLDGSFEMEPLPDGETRARISVPLG